MSTTSRPEQTYSVRRAATHWVASFAAMASPCEILMRCSTVGEADSLASLAFSETRRIERKFSRYRDDNIVHTINHSNGQAVSIDSETFQLLHYAAECHSLSEGAFDITSGVLRKAWQFKGGEVTPDQALIDSLLERIGWDKAALTVDALTLQPGMEIDLGGIGKEYAADRVAQLLWARLPVPVMVNFGGDIRAISGSADSAPWVIGIEDPEAENTAIGKLELTNGAVATSGDARRHCLVNGERLGHILDPRTGWPVRNAPRSVTVIAGMATEAGLLATLAMLRGPNAEAFLEAQGVAYHCIR